MKIKKTPKDYLDPNEVEGYNTKIKLKWGYLFLYCRKTNKNKWNYEVIWNDPDNFVDNTIEMKKNQEFDNKKDCFYYLLSLAQDYFERHPIKNNIEKNVGMLEDLKGALLFEIKPSC